MNHEVMLNNGTVIETDAPDKMSAHLPDVVNTTLVTELLVSRPTDSVRLRDVPLRIESRRGYTDLELTVPTLGVTIRLNGAERVALIEALGGKV